ncbi:hypothetical protein INR49_024968 [Caranx melampygus]|nr:hypothetical protein INR49_024968 [Caranx melampygus]
MAADRVTRHGDPCDHIGCASAVVVEPPADDVLMHFPGTDVELSDLRDHVCERVGGRFVIRIGLVLIWVQLSTLKDHRVGIVFEDGLGIFKTLKEHQTSCSGRSERGKEDDQSTVQ